MKAMAVMAAALPGEVDEATARLWRSEFGGLPADVLERSARIAYRTLKFFPSVPDFMAIVIRELGGEIPIAEEAWVEVERAKALAPGTRRSGCSDAVWSVVEQMDYAPFDVTADSARMLSHKKTFLALWNARRQKAIDTAMAGVVVSRPQMPAPVDRARLTN